MSTHRPSVVIAAAVILTALLSVLIGLGVAPAAGAAESDGPMRVLVVGDSITQSAQVPIIVAIEDQGAEVRLLAWGGTAPCDWIGPVAETVAETDPDLVLIEFAGNDLTPCIADTPRESAGFLDRYRTDSQALTDAAGAGGAVVRWSSVPYIDHRQHEAVARDLNRLYRSEPSLHRRDFDGTGFDWIDCHDSTQSVLSYIRRDGEDFHVVVLNFTPVVRRDYRIGVPRSGRYSEVFNSDSRFYGGADNGNPLTIRSEPRSWMGRTDSIVLTLPPLGALVLRLVEER